MVARISGRFSWAAAVWLTVCSLEGLAGERLLLKGGSVDPQRVAQDLARSRRTLQPLARQAAPKFFVVQFREPITPEDRGVLVDLGFKIARYLPDDALIVDAQEAGHQLKLLQADSRVRAVVPYAPEWRISPKLEGAEFGLMGERVTLLLTTFDEQRAEAVAARAREIRGAQLHSVDGSSVVVDLPASAVPVLARVEGVEWVEPYVPFQLMHLPLDQSWVDGGENRDYASATGYETGTKVMNFDLAWERGLTGENQVVAMADTGLDSGDAKTLTTDFIASFLTGEAFGLFTRSWSDPMGHGTHVGGSVVSDGNISGGLFRGGAPAARFVAQGMWSNMIKGLTPPSQFSKMFDKAYKSGARIHTNSWGQNGAGEYDGNAQQVDRYMWENPDFLILFAAGNSGVDLDGNGRIDPNSVGSPATAKNTLAVGASENYLLEGGIQRKLGELKGGKAWSAEPLASDRLSDNPSGIAAFSSRGPTEDGRLKPDVVAPGTNIVSNCSKVEGASPLWGNYNQDYCYSGGTSMSTPLTAGAATVVRQFLIRDLQFAQPSAALIKAVLMNTADDLYPGQYGEVGEAAGQELLKPGPNPDQGHGRVNVGSATAKENLIAFDETAGVAQGETWTQSLGGESIRRITLVYTDAPAAASARKALVNNLDLSVTLADGTVLNSNSEIDNSEFLILGPSGESVAVAEVRVSGTRIPQGRSGRQPFALVISRR